jgi:hypothetical protein
MTARRARFAGLLPVALALGCGSSGRAPYSLDVGSDDGGAPISLGSGLDARAQGALDAHIERNHITVTFVTLSCAGPCADVVAVPTGGQAPYTFKWDDGSASASRHVCPTSSTSYSVKVTDTGTSGELARAAQTVQVPLAANVVACPDGGARDAGLPSCDPDAAGPVISPSTVEVDANGSTRYVMNGASLPAGRYQAEWTDGCMRYAVGGPMFGWDVNDPPPAVFAGPVGVSTMDPGYCVVVDGQNGIVAELPGATGSGTSDYASCVAQVSSTAPVQFSFPGGKMGVLANDFGAGDNVQGESAGGVSPTWRITFLSACP